MPASTALFRLPTPQDAELFLRRARLAALRSQLAAREASLARLRNQLHSFEGRYIRQVGVLYVQLDEWHTRIANLQVAAESMEDTERLLREAQQREAQNTPTGVPHLDSESGEPQDPNDPKPHDLKSLFREVAKRLHPDFATDPHDERRRNHLMAQANDALQRQDAALLLRMLNGYDPSTGFGEPTNLAAELARTLTQIIQIEADILAVDAALAELTQSQMADLQRRTALAAELGRDLLAELAAQVKGSIGLAMRRYELELGRLRRNQPAFNPEPLLSAEIHNP